MHKPWDFPQLKQIRKERTEKKKFLCMNAFKSLPYCPLHSIPDTFSSPFEKHFY